MKYIAKTKTENKPLLETWVNKFSDLPENSVEASEVAKMLGYTENEFVVKAVNEAEYVYMMKGNN